MDLLTVIVVGGDIFKISESIFDDFQLAHVNQINNGHLGNFRIRIHIFDLGSHNSIVVRKKLMTELYQNGMQPAYLHGDWSTVMVFSKAVLPRRMRKTTV